MTIIILLILVLIAWSIREIQFYNTRKELKSTTRLLGSYGDMLNLIFDESLKDGYGKPPEGQTLLRG